MRELGCVDVGIKACNFVAQGNDDDEVVKKMAEHAKNAHGTYRMLPEVEKKVRAAIRDAGALKDAQGKPFTLGQSKLG
jgi:predicted small metal-binding protein